MAGLDPRHSPFVAKWFFQHFADCKYNLVYIDVVIAEEKLDCIEDGCEHELPANTREEDDENDLDKSEVDMGPTSSDQIEDVLQTEEYTEEVSNTLRGNGLSANLSEHNHTLYNHLNEACKQSKIPNMSWPHVSTKATSGCDKHSKLFPEAFPWLFPGGIGDYNQYSPIF
jgi:hypothetical protein